MVFNKMNILSNLTFHIHWSLTYKHLNALKHIQWKLISLAFIFIALIAWPTFSKPNPNHPIRNVILLIPDGCGIAHMTIARWYKGISLAQDSMDVSLVKTHSTNSMITGSAAAATALACGYKTIEQQGKATCLGMLPGSIDIAGIKELKKSDQWRPVATVLEGARLQGKSTGIIVTSRVSHATPAGFASHWHSRYDNNCIMEQLVYQNIDVMFGGGLRHLINNNDFIPGSKQKGKRKDGENLLKVLKGMGYSIIRTAKELNKLPQTTKKVWGMFANNNMVHEIDRKKLSPHEPSLREMVERAILILNNNPKGFFLMVEGSQIDWASHNNDPVGLVTDFMAFDSVVQAVLHFAKSEKGKGTMVLVVSDHDNGGMSLGRCGTNIYTFKPEKMLKSIHQASLTAAGTAGLLKKNINRFHPNKDKLKTIIHTNYGISDLTDSETQLLVDEITGNLKLGKSGNLLFDIYGNPKMKVGRINLKKTPRIDAQ